MTSDNTSGPQVEIQTKVAADEPIDSADPPHIKPEERSINHSRMEFLLECFKLAREESMARIRNRDGWLKYQLFSQVALFAIFQGIEVSGIKPIKAIPEILALSPVISAVFFSMYTIENSLVGFISRYIASISITEQRLNGGEQIKNWDASQEYRSRYVTATLPIRTVVQSLTFLILPSVIVSYRLYNLPRPWTNFTLSECMVDVGILVFCVYLLWINHTHRARIIRDINPA